MAYIEPDGEIRILTGVPLDPSYENTLYFDSEANQREYFMGLTNIKFTNQSYTRKSRGWIKVGNPSLHPTGTLMSMLVGASYMMFKNASFENKWFYAFIDEIEYVNNNTAEIRYHIDVLQTWHFDYRFNECLIERQHTPTDVFGEHTIPEQLEHGEYLCGVMYYREQSSGHTGGPNFEYQPGVLLVTSVTQVDPVTHTPIYERGEVVSGLNTPWGDYFSGVKQFSYSLSAIDINALNNTLENLTNVGQANGVLSLNMIAKDFVDSYGQPLGAKSLIFSAGNSIGSYTPRNKKLLCYPYNIFYVTNNQGNVGEYRFEDFSNPSSIAFSIWGNASPNCALICYPLDYKSNYQNTDEKITLTGFPMCSWTIDSFRAWLAQNAGTLVAAAGTLLTSWASLIGLGAAMGGGGMGDPYGLVGGGGGQALLGGNIGAPQMGLTFASPSNGLIGATLGALGQLYDHARVPPQAKGENNPNIVYQAGLLTFSFYRKYIKPEYAEIIDKYFDMYGYKINKVGVPNRNVRRKYTYVKTIGCSVDGDVPTSDRTIIESIFNKGVRFWRESAVFGSFDPSVNDNTV